MGGNAGAQGSAIGTLREMPRYECHKIVRAAKINSFGASYLMVEWDGQETRVTVPDWWMAKHEPRCFGYFVMYEDGYTSFSPAQQFEAGYTRILKP